jgi:long-chain acyl-CoA synthetase
MNLYESFSATSQIHYKKIALVCEDGRFTYEELQIKTDLFASLLESISTNSNCFRFGLLTFNTVNDLAILFAAAKLNLEILVINPELNRNQIEVLLKEAGISILIIRQEQSAHYNDCVVLGNLENSIILDTLRKFNNIISQNKSYLITASSGSTGNPKPIVFSQETKYLRMLQSRDIYNVSEEDVILNASGLYHSLGQRLTFLPLLNGCTLVMLSKFNQYKWIKSIEIENVTFTIAVSTHLHALSQYLLSDNVKKTALAKLVSSSAAINFETKLSLYNNPKFQFYEQYGASEVATVSNCSARNFNEHNNTVGVLCDGVSVEIHNQSDKPSDSGEVKVKTPLAFLGYMKDGELQTFARDSFFRTSDEGSLKGNYLFFHGRMNEVINRGGQKIYPQDLENHLLNNKNIYECKVIKANHPYFGEIPIAFIVPLPGICVTISEINSWALINIPRFQIPGDYFLIETLPRLGSGKIDILKLQIMYESDRHLPRE